MEKMGDSNYETWKIHMKSVLILSVLWSYTNGSKPKPTTDEEKWKIKDNKALELIFFISRKLS